MKHYVEFEERGDGKLTLCGVEAPSPEEALWATLRSNFEIRDEVESLRLVSKGWRWDTLRVAKPHTVRKWVVDAVVRAASSEKTE
jgi:hypothetical protein